MRQSRLLWFALYVALTLAPGLVALLADPLDGWRPMLMEMSAALGFVAFAVVATQFALVSRLQTPSRPFGTDALVQFHQYVGMIGVILLAGHALLLNWEGLPWRAWSPFDTGRVAPSGALSLWTVVLLAATTVFRQRLRLGYETWRVLHLGLATLAILAMLRHALAAAGYTQAAPVRYTLYLFVAAAGLATLQYRLLRPFTLRRRPWEVLSNVDAGGSTRLLRLRPVGHAGIQFDPGQFAWLLTGPTPLLAQQHPLSIASSAKLGPDRAVEFLVKALGDWSSETVPALTPGTRVWVDGPFGVFTTERIDGRGFVMIAGGIGIAPMRSMLLSLRDRNDRRPVVLFYAVHDQGRLIVREEIAQLRESLALTLVLVLEAPPSDWSGERGQINVAMLQRHLPARLEGYHCFVCGPPPMMDAVERTLVTLGIPAASIDSERFNVV